MLGEYSSHLLCSLKSFCLCDDRFDRIFLKPTLMWIRWVRRSKRLLVSRPIGAVVGSNLRISEDSRCIIILAVIDANVRLKNSKNYRYSQNLSFV